MCGAAVEVPATASATPRSCPRCRAGGEAALVGRLVDGFLLDECPACAGVFVDQATLERLIDARRQASAADAAAGAPRRHTAPIPAQPPRASAAYIPCPDCGQLMNRQNFARASGVLVDVCGYHGTWFDADELPRIVAFVQDGGLDRAARRSIEIEREELRAERARLQVEASRSTGILHAGTHVHDYASFLRAMGRLLG
jgi:Zn-finger nucleic acid-binding protein